jgi:hypothetical protein
MAVDTETIVRQAKRYADDVRRVMPIRKRNPANGQRHIVKFSK